MSPNMPERNDDYKCTTPLSTLMASFREPGMAERDFLAALKFYYSNGDVYVHSWGVLPGTTILHYLLEQALDRSSNDKFI